MLKEPNDIDGIILYNTYYTLDKIHNSIEVKKLPYTDSGYIAKKMIYFLKTLIANQKATTRAKMYKEIDILDKETA